MNRKRIIIWSVVAVLVIVNLFFFFNNKKSPNQELVNPEEEEVSNEPEAQKENSLNKVNEAFEESAEILTKDIVRKSIVGKWQSLDNLKYHVEFTSLQDMVEELLPNKTIGKWELVDFNNGPDDIISTISFSTDGVFLRQILDDGKNSFYYKVLQVDQNRLVLIYLNQGGILGFNRIR